MSGKKAAGRFTLQFSVTDPVHIRVIDILNSQRQRSKAQYIANAVFHYESCGAVPQTTCASIDERTIEKIVQRLLAQQNDLSIEQIETTPTFSVHQPEGINFDDSVDTLGTEGLDAVLNAMSAFRNE